MAGVKITDLPLLSETPADNDLLVIVDANLNLTKQITVSDLVSATPKPENVLSAQKIQVDQNNGASLYYLTMVSSLFGTDSVKTANNLSFDASNGIFSAPAFEGNGGLLTNVLADSALRSANAILSQKALNADFALEAGTASFSQGADSATTATFATNSTSATFADSATQAALALYSNVSGFSLGTDSAVNAYNAVNALRADSATNATFALVAQTADAAVTSQFSDSAARATSALFALRATDAVNAVYADSALYATNAGFALEAVRADSAINASNAIYAQFALQSLTALKNIDDSATGVRIFGETTIDSDLYVKGIIHGDGSGLTNVSSTSVSAVSKQVGASLLDSSGLHYVMLRTLSSGYDSVSVTNSVTYDPLTEIFLAPSFSGDGALLTNVSAVSANFASAVEVTTVNDASTYFVHLGSTTSGNDNVNIDVDLKYNPGTNTLITGSYSVGDWYFKQEGTDVFFFYQGIKKARLDTSGNLAIAGTLTESATL